jgi:[protein-PII] uridylyltransferase
MTLAVSGPAPAPAAAGEALLSSARERLVAGRRELRERFQSRPDARRLLRAHARLVDSVLRELWAGLALPPAMALVAVGGYGRGELYPHSDIDVLILAGDDPVGEDAAAVGRFLGNLWDVGLEVAHSVRTLAECGRQMAADVTVTTSLLEHRLLAGHRALFGQFAGMLAHALDPRAFYEAKVLEQQQRHLRHHDATYNLEPNIKENPGGLRDLQTVLWIARAAGIGRSWSDLARAGLLTPAEARETMRQEALIAGLRIRLHYLAGRREDRLVFDLQSRLAREVGVADTAHRRASEHLMQRYYRAAKTVRQVNTIMVQNLHVRIFPENAPARPLDEEFQVVDELLDVRDEALYERRPAAILESFLRLQQNPELKGMSARTLRAVWRNRHRVDARFRRDPGNRQTFLAIFRQPRGITHELRRMNQYDVLGRYLPPFGRIVGQMQHDLFHVYTVDEHTLMVIRNLRRFTEVQHAHEHPLATELMADFERPEVLYLAGLFHDIAKGRGGDHSRLGAVDARRFCRDHGLAPEDVELVAWLVENHLAMSATAQKQDISDPAVRESFAGRVGSARRLVALYLLTVADIRGTSPKVWTAWKGRLLEDLFHASRRILAGQMGGRTLQDSLRDRREEALRLLRLHAIPPGAEQPLWSKLDSLYFQRHTSDEIAWHARQLLRRVELEAPVVRARQSKGGEGLQVLVYLRDQPNLFARVCGFFGRASFSILEARIHTTRHGYALDSFVVLDPSHRLADYRDIISFVEFELAKALVDRRPLEMPPVGRVSRRLKHFPITPEVRIFPDESGRHHILEITAGDRPGLLGQVAYTLAVHGINVHSARINTLGERAEDVFLIEGASLCDQSALLRLEAELLDRLRI